MSIVTKFKNTDAYMKSFSKRLVELLRIELERNRTRNSSRGSYCGKINDTGELARSLKSIYEICKSKNITFVLLKGFPTDFENHFYNVDVEFFNEQINDLFNFKNIPFENYYLIFG